MKLPPMTPKEAAEVRELIAAWYRMSPLDRSCFAIMVRWWSWRPAWLKCLDDVIRFCLFAR